MNLKTKKNEEKILERITKTKSKNLNLIRRHLFHLRRGPIDLKGKNSRETRMNLETLILICFLLDRALVVLLLK